MIDPYEGLDDAERAKCVNRIFKTLTRKPKRHDERNYVKSLTPHYETPDQFRARSLAIAQKIVADAEARSKAPPVHLRLTSTKPKGKRRQGVKKWACRGRARHREEYSGQGRVARDLDATIALRAKLYLAQEGVCGICGKPMSPHEKASIDHVIPLAMGGTDVAGNHIVAHGECNGEKSNDVPTGCEMIWLLAVNARIGALPVVY